MSMLAAQIDELRKMAAAMSEHGSAIGLDYGMGLGLVVAARMMREAADTIDALATALEDVLRNAGDTVWVGKAETLVDRMVALGIYGHEVYDGARPWEVE